jgi:metal-responsive CopG/Arc/MetJ family transcriptional regulator
MREFTVRAPDGLAAQADDEAQRQGVSRAELWRTAMAVYLADRDSAAIKRRIARCERKLGLDGPAAG